MFQGITDPNVQTALALLEARINYISNERRTLSSRLAVLEDDDDPRPVRPGNGGGAFPTHIVFRAAGSTAVPTKTGRFLWIDTVNETLTWSSSNVNPTPGVIIILDSERREFVVTYP